MENGRHRVFKFATFSFDMSLHNEKLDYVFKELKCAANVNFAFGFVLKNIEDGICRYSYAHENNTIVERSKIVCTQADMTNQKNRRQKLDFVELCTRGWANTKRKLYKLTILTIFASLLKAVAWVVKIQFYLNHFWETVMWIAWLLRKKTLKLYKDNLCLFRALALHLSLTLSWWSLQSKDKGQNEMMRIGVAEENGFRDQVWRHRNWYGLMLPNPRCGLSLFVSVCFLDTNRLKVNHCQVLEQFLLISRWDVPCIQLFKKVLLSLRKQSLGKFL